MALTAYLSRGSVNKRVWHLLGNILSKLAFWKIWRKDRPIVPVVRLNGVIASDGRFRNALNLSAVAPALRAAFKLKGAKAVALSINSPGGSPVQSHLIFKRVRALAEEHDLPVFAFAEDVAASGGYMLLAAGDKIYADESSIVGSIGVISASFGFEDAIGKLGVTRRVHTSGEKKSTLDPFLPEDPQDVERLEALQNEVHGHFKTLVRSRRGDHLTAEDGKLFTGEFWSGPQAKELGLVDDIGDLRTVMRREFGDKVRLPIISQERPFWRRAMAGMSLSQNRGGMSGLPAAGSLWAEELITALESRSIWSRFGL